MGVALSVSRTQLQRRDHAPFRIHYTTFVVGPRASQVADANNLVEIRTSVFPIARRNCDDLAKELEESLKTIKSQGRSETVNILRLSDLRGGTPSENWLSPQCCRSAWRMSFSVITFWSYVLITRCADLLLVFSETQLRIISRIIPCNINIVLFRIVSRIFSSLSLTCNDVGKKIPGFEGLTRHHNAVFEGCH
jgi:hypothetical protein